MAKREKEHGNGLIAITVLF